MQTSLLCAIFKLLPFKAFRWRYDFMFEINSMACNRLLKFKRSLLMEIYTCHKYFEKTAIYSIIVFLYFEV